MCSFNVQLNRRTNDMYNFWHEETKNIIRISDSKLMRYGIGLFFQIQYQGHVSNIISSKCCNT